MRPRDGHAMDIRALFRRMRQGQAPAPPAPAAPPPASAERATTAPNDAPAGRADGPPGRHLCDDGHRAPSGTDAVPPTTAAASDAAGGARAGARAPEGSASSVPTLERAARPPPPPPCPPDRLRRTDAGASAGDSTGASAGATPTTTTMTAAPTPSPAPAPAAAPAAARPHEDAVRQRKRCALRAAATSPPTRSHCLTPDRRCGTRCRHPVGCRAIERSCRTKPSCVTSPASPASRALAPTPLPMPFSHTRRSRAPQRPAARITLPRASAVGPRRDARPSRRRAGATTAYIPPGRSHVWCAACCGTPPARQHAHASTQHASTHAPLAPPVSPSRAPPLRCHLRRRPVSLRALAAVQGPLSGDEDDAVSGGGGQGVGKGEGQEEKEDGAVDVHMGDYVVKSFGDGDYQGMVVGACCSPSPGPQSHLSRGLQSVASVHPSVHPSTLLCCGTATACCGVRRAACGVLRRAALGCPSFVRPHCPSLVRTHSIRMLT